LRRPPTVVGAGFHVYETDREHVLHTDALLSCDLADRLREMLSS
jgi:hypothetical protein